MLPLLGDYIYDLFPEVLGLTDLCLLIGVCFERSVGFLVIYLVDCVWVVVSNWCTCCSLVFVV